MNLSEQAGFVAYSAGRRTAVDCFNGRHDCVDVYAADSVSSDERIATLGKVALFGFAYGVAELLAQTGCTFSVEVPSPQHVVYLEEREPGASLAVIPLLLASVRGLRAQVSGVSASFGLTVEKVSKPAPGDEKPQRVEIVAMPNRETETMFERDPTSLELTKSKQVERDGV